MKRKRRVSPDKIRQAVGGVPRGWYERIAVAKKECSGCAKGEPCAACREKAAMTQPAPPGSAIFPEAVS